MAIDREICEAQAEFAGLEYSPVYFGVRVSGIRWRLWNPLISRDDLAEVEAKIAMHAELDEQYNKAHDDELGMKERRPYSAVRRLLPAVCARLVPPMTKREFYTIVIAHAWVASFGGIQNHPNAKMLHNVVPQLVEAAIAVSEQP